MNNNQNQKYQNNNQEVAKEQKDKARISVKAIEFKGTFKSELTTLVDLCVEVNKLFRPIFANYDGCVISLNGYNGQLETSLYFKATPNAASYDNDKIKAVVPRAELLKRNNNALDRITSFNMRTSTKQYDATQEFKEMMEEFMSMSAFGGGKKINWNNLIVERVENGNQQFYNTYNILVEVKGLDILKILRKIYGKNVDGNRVDYNINLVKPMGNNVMGPGTNYMINIQQLNTSEVEKLANKVGMIPSVGTIPIVRG